LFISVIVSVVAACGDVSSRSVACGATPIQVLPNGNFDNPSPPWVQTPVTPAALCGQPTVTPFNGTTVACMGGRDGATTKLVQSPRLRKKARQATLTAQICIATAETEPVERDVLQFSLVDEAGGTIAELGKATNQQGSAACQFMPLELSAPLSSDPPTATL